MKINSYILAFTLTTVVGIVAPLLTFAQNSAQNDNSIESMLLRNHNPRSRFEPTQKPSRTDEVSDKFSVETPEPKAIPNLVSPSPPQGNSGERIFRNLSRSVVLIIASSGESLGSGALISKSGDIVTNWHVVGESKEVLVAFKPSKEGRKPERKDFIRARVIKVDDVADLALIHVDRVPDEIKPLSLGRENDVLVGADVHAIGHPKIHLWSYTKGVISQVREGFTWQNRGDKIQHKANVIQTQTPINPGNSGGPLFSDSGLLIGINSFTKEGDGLNFAVAVDELQRFLNSHGNRLTETKIQNSETARTSTACKPKTLYNDPSTDKAMKKRGIDFDCDGKPDMEVRTPYNRNKPISVAFDNNKDGYPDEIIFDFDRDEKWDYSLHDTNFDSKWDLIGHHPDGKLKPSRYEKYTEK